MLEDIKNLKLETIRSSKDYLKGYFKGDFTLALKVQCISNPIISFFEFRTTKKTERIASIMPHFCIGKNERSICRGFRSIETCQKFFATTFKDSDALQIMSIWKTNYKLAVLLYTNASAETKAALKKQLEKWECGQVWRLRKTKT